MNLKIGLISKLRNKAFVNNLPDTFVLFVQKIIVLSY